MKEAVVALIMKDGKVLSVSRKTDHNDIGFPGGAVEVSESSQDAIIREVFEETGLTITKCRLVDERLESPDVSVKMYIVDQYEGEINTTETGLVQWVTPDDLCSDNCTFKDYNIALFNELLYVELIANSLLADLYFEDRYTGEELSEEVNNEYQSTIISSVDLGIALKIATTDDSEINREIGVDIMRLAIKRLMDQPIK